LLAAAGVAAAVYLLAAAAAAEMRLEPASNEPAELQRWLDTFAAANPSMVRLSHLCAAQTELRVVECASI
jgi:hypothetical protein